MTASNPFIFFNYLTFWHLRQSPETPTLNQNDSTMSTTADEIRGKPLPSDLIYSIIYIHTYHTRFIPKRPRFTKTTELRRIGTADVIGGKPIPVLSQSISGESVII
jgi:hypothetical protein